MYNADKKLRDLCLSQLHKINGSELLATVFDRDRDAILLFSIAH